MRKGILSDEEFRRRYQRLLPADGSIPYPPIPQDDFADEQRTRAPQEVRAIYNERFSAYRQSQRGGCGLLAATVALIPLALALLALMY